MVSNIRSRNSIQSTKLETAWSPTHSVAAYTSLFRTITLMIAGLTKYEKICSRTQDANKLEWAILIAKRYDTILFPWRGLGIGKQYSMTRIRHWKTRLRHPPSSPSRPKKHDDAMEVDTMTCTQGLLPVKSREAEHDLEKPMIQILSARIYARECVQHLANSKN